MIEIQIQQDTNEWNEFRKNHIGSSDAPIIMGASPWTNSIDLWEEKIGFIKDKKPNFAMKRGKILEPLALEEFENQMHLLMMPKVFKSSDIEYISASLDGISFCNKIAVEIKCPGKKDHELALSGKIPDKYIPQLQHQLYVTELDKMYYFSYTPSTNKILEIYRNEEYIKILLEKEKIFWESVLNSDIKALNF